MTENERLNHKLDVSKIKTLKDVKNVFECMNLIANASEDNEQYELLKEYFTIPNDPQELVGFKLPRKSLEEITQELDEKINKSYCCPKCGDQIGYIGRFFQFLRIPLHRCKK